MNTRTLGIALLGLTLVLGSTLAGAQDKTQGTGGSTAKPAAKASAKPAATRKVVDLNSASKAELKQLPGIGDAEADKIIAARPLRTKGELLSRNLIPDHVYPQIKSQVAAKNPPKPKLDGTPK